MDTPRELSALSPLERDLLASARKGDPIGLAAALALGAGPDFPKNIDFPFNPLKAACVSDAPGALECARLLLRAGADPNHPRHEPWPLLPRVCELGHEACARLLIDAGAHVDALDHQDATGEDDDWTALQRALPHPAIVSMLLAAGADPSFPGGKDGITPLMICMHTSHDPAAAAARLHSASLLIAAGASIEQLSAQGESALDFALRLENPGGVAFLRQTLEKAELDRSLPAARAAAKPPRI